jgi:hypothetical protein
MMDDDGLGFLKSMVVASPIASSPLDGKTLTNEVEKWMG